MEVLRTCGMKIWGSNRANVMNTLAVCISSTQFYLYCSHKPCQTTSFPHHHHLFFFKMQTHWYCVTSESSGFQQVLLKSAWLLSSSKTPVRVWNVGKMRCVTDFSQGSGWCGNGWPLTGRSGRALMSAQLRYHGQPMTTAAKNLPWRLSAQQIEREAAREAT